MKAAISLVSALLLTGIAQADVLADSEAEFSGTQGLDGWYYGYYTVTAGDSPSMPGSFREADNFDSDFADSWSFDGNGDWLGISDRSQHPHLPGAGRNTPGEHWATRRWVSDVSGDLQLTGLIDEADLGGDSTDVFIYIDGTQIQTWTLSTTTNSMIEYDIPVTVSNGSIIDFIVAPRQNINFDGTVFTVIINGDAPCIADLNNDGELDFLDISIFIFGYTKDDPGADLTGDGEVDFLDVSLFINSYTTGCPRSNSANRLRE